VHLETRPEERSEETDPFEMIHVQVREKDVDRVPVSLHQRAPERTETRAGVQDDQRSIAGIERQARRVPAVSLRVLARRRE
jgi:hypothetical protein